MSNHTTGTMSSKKMRPSPYSKEVIRLGKDIASELDRKGQIDTLGRWMSHYLSEVIDSIDKVPARSRKEAQTNCAKLIIDLWAHRTSLPMHAKPLGLFDKVVEAIGRIRSDTPYYFRPVPGVDKEKLSDDVLMWLMLAEKTDQIAQSVVRRCMQNAVSCASKREQKWLENGLDVLDDKDAHIVALVDRLKQVDGVESQDRVLIDIEEFGKLCTEIVEKSKGPKDHVKTKQSRKKIKPKYMLES